MAKTIISTSAEQTIEIARDLALHFRGGEVICLVGDLGTGKTQFAKGIALGLGVEETVNSPTYVLLKQYPYRDNLGHQFTFNHLDLYRIEGDVEAIGFGFDDLLTSNQVTVIEWAQRLEYILPHDALYVYFQYIDENERKIEIHGRG